MTDLVLTPAACYPVYPAIAARGPLPAGRRDGRRRRRLRLPPRALRRPGAPADVPPARARPDRRAGDRRRRGATRWRDRGARAAARRSASTPTSTSPPTRSSAAAAGCSPRSQREQALKFEILVPIAGPEPTAVASFNYHQDHFAAAYGIEHWRTASVAHTACLGFGLERITLALLRAARPRPAARGRRRCAQRAVAAHERDGAGHGQPLRPRSRDLPAAPAARRRAASTPRPTATPTS